MTEITSEAQLRELLGEPLLRTATQNCCQGPAHAARVRRAQITQRLERPDETLEDLQRYYGPAYSAGLYRDNSPETGKDPNRADPPSEH